MSAPALPYNDWGACPGEGCVYREWTARERTPVYSTWERDRRTIGQLSPREKVTAITGVVITFKPGVIRVERDLPEHGLKPGDTILTYAYRGEGFSAVWFKGRYFREFDISFTKFPDGTGCGGEYCGATSVDLGKKTWWVKVKLKSGQVGWVDMDHADFEGICAFATRQENPYLPKIIASPGDAGRPYGAQSRH
jgi:hypothetical protein